MRPPLTELRGQRCQAGCSPEGRTESDTTEAAEHTPITELGAHRGREMDLTNGHRISCLCHPPVSALVLLGKPEQTQRTGHPDLLGQQTRVWGPVLCQAPSPGALPTVHPTPQVQGLSPAQLCSPLSLSLPIPDLTGAQGNSGVPFWFLLPLYMVLPSSRDALLAGGSGQVAWVCDGQGQGGRKPPARVPT